MKYRVHPIAAVLAAVLATGALSGCETVAVGTTAVGAALIPDRRSPGAQVDDESIELRSAARLRQEFGERAHVNVSSYNRQVLLTGEVPTEAVRQQVEQIVARIDNVRGVVNELAVMAPTSLAQRSNDLLITGKVRASFVDASDLQAKTFRVVTERATVYLMGRVTQREAERGTNIARQIGGVQKVVRIFEIVGADGMPVPAASAAPAPAPAPAPAVEPVAPQPAPAGGAVVTPIR